MGWENDVVTAEHFNQGMPWLDPGRYRLEIIVQKRIKGFHGEKFIVEFQVHESTNPDHPPGSKRAWTRSLDGKNKNMGVADVKSFLMVIIPVYCARNGIAFEQLTKEWVQWSISEPCPLAGIMLDTEAFMNKGRTFTQFRWRILEPGEELGLVMQQAPETAPAIVPAPAITPSPATVTAPPPPGPPQAGTLQPLPKNWPADMAVPEGFYRT